MDWNACPRKAPDLDLSEVTDGFVVSRNGSERIHYLNATAAFILECCDGSLRAGELPGIVAAAFRLDHALTDDVEDCLRMLASEGLLSY
jgi:hypothetical protein